MLAGWRIVGPYGDRLMPFVLARLSSSNERHKLAALVVLKHLINSCDEQLADASNSKKQQVALALQPLVAHKNQNRVSLSLDKIIRFASSC